MPIFLLKGLLGFLYSVLQALIKFLEDCTKSGSIVPLDKKVHVFLWLLTNASSCNEVGLLFNLHKSTVNVIFHEIASMLTEQRYHFISWPSMEEQHLTRLKVNSRFKFPNCVGFIDACRLKVSSIRNKRSKPDIVLLQAVCDESLMFMDIHVGEIGKQEKANYLERVHWLGSWKTLLLLRITSWAIRNISYERI